MQGDGPPEPASLPSEPSHGTGGQGPTTGSNEPVFRAAPETKSVFRPAAGTAEGPRRGQRPVPKKPRRRKRSAKVPPLASALWYPLTGAGTFVLALYAVLLSLAKGALMIPLGGWLFALVVEAYVGLLFLETAAFTLARVRQGPRLPGLSFSNIATGLFALVAMMIAGAPLLIKQLTMGTTGVLSPPIDVALFVVALCYTPMAFLALAVMESEWALNPLVVFRGIVRMPVIYFSLVGLAAVGFLVPAVAVFKTGIHPLLADLAWTYLLIYVVVALMRAVTLAYVRGGHDLESP